MDGLSLYKRAKSTSNYWPNAVLFTFCNSLMGIKVLKSLDSQLKENCHVPEHDSVSIFNQFKSEIIQKVSNLNYLI
jgi:hypothetical protein